LWWIFGEGVGGSTPGSQRGKVTAKNFPHTKKKKKKWGGKKVEIPWGGAPGGDRGGKARTRVLFLVGGDTKTNWLKREGGA